MRIVVQGSGSHVRVRVLGAGAALAVIGVCVLLRALGGSPSPREAEERLRLVLAREVSQAHLAEMRESGASLPDERMAARWQADFEVIERIEVLDIEVRRPLPDTFSPRPAFVVKASLREATGEKTRYFWLSRHGFDHEAAALLWRFAL
jgi:hypothetical protein